MSQLCFITTCRGRRQHLEQSLPLLVAQPGATCVVVDYDCPDGTGDWVEAHYPQVKVVRSGPRPRFEIARARNLGAGAAASPWLCFVDADALLTPDFSQIVLALLERGNYYRAMPEARDTSGTCIVHRDDFDVVEGYDAVLQGWGMEDKDFYFRLRQSGVAMKSFPGSLVSMIPHGGAMRTAHYDNKSTYMNSTLNLVYCRAKWDLMRLQGKKLDEAARTALYRNISGLVGDAQKRETSVQLRIPVDAAETLTGASLRVSLVYDLSKPADKAAKVVH